MSARAGIVITGTEVLTGIIADKNGPWLSERLRDRGVQLATTTIVGDRPEDLLAALQWQASLGLDLIITSGGLGPTADDLTTQIVADFAGRAMVLDPALEGRIHAILERYRSRWPDVDEEAFVLGNRKQATVPEGATILEPVGTAPGLIVPPLSGSGPTVVVLPGPPGELQPMWKNALTKPALQAALTDAGTYERKIMRMFGMPESELAGSLRAIEGSGLDLSALEITTCLRRGEIEVATTYDLADRAAYDGFEAALLERHGRITFARDGETIDQIVAELLLERAWTIATAESCTGGLLAGRLTDRAGSSAYVLGGVVVYSNAAKIAFADVDPALIEAHGAVSEEVARALACGVRTRFGASVGVGITGIAGPGGGTEEKPVGLVHLCVEGPDGALHRATHLPGDRERIREFAVTTSMHLIRRVALGAL